MFIFSIRGSKKIFVIVLLCKTKNLRIRVWKSRIFVFVLSKKCAQTKNLCVRGSAQTKNLRKKAEFFVVGIFLYRQNYEEKNVIND